MPDAIQSLSTGKVRDTYAIPGQPNQLLIVASDRISVFDVVLDQPVPGKGKVLTAMTEFWLRGLLAGVPHHLISTDVSGLPSYLLDGVPDLVGRGMVVKKAEMLPIECIVRGYLYGSVMKEYAKSQTASGVSLPRGLEKASQLPEAIFTPSTKAVEGHDENITLDQAEDLVDAALLERVRRLSLTIYRDAAIYAMERGIILADTKFEWGLVDGVLTLCDEVLTPDSSRFWELESWEPGKEPVSFDKQFVRNYYAELGWDKTPPAPHLPDGIIGATQKLYDLVLERLTTDT